MKKYIYLVLLFFTILFTQAQQPFITTWEVTAVDLDITIPTDTYNYTYNYTIDFGDGTTLNNQTGDITHTYSTAGIYSVAIYGDFPRFLGYVLTLQDKDKLKTVEQWGDIEWKSMAGMFQNFHNLNIFASDAPDLSNVTSLAAMFWAALSFNQNINHWDVSKITDMSGMFSRADLFNQPLDNWDVSNVVDMRSMFSDSFSFLSNYSFNQSLNSWDVSSVTDMSEMFKNSTSFNQPLNNWNVSSVEDMTGMFENAKVFNQPISSWDVSNVSSMRSMFADCNNFNQDLNSWDVSSIVDMENLFDGAQDFNKPLDNWDVSNVVDMSGMFRSSDFNQPLNNWDVSSVIDMSYMFRWADFFNQPLDNWNVSSVVDMEYMFTGADSFNQNINNWDVSNVTTMRNMFSGTSSFNQPLDNWDVSNVGSMRSMFRGAILFNQNINSWNVNLVDISNIFNNASSFNQPLDNWNVNSSSLQGAFSSATSFNQNIESWNVSNTTNMVNMFRNATSFNQPLNNWDVSNVEYMEGMFEGATSFNQPLDNWEVSELAQEPFTFIKFERMFSGASSFNQDLSSWNFTQEILQNFLNDSGMDSVNYDLIVKRLVNLGLENGALDAVNIGYCDAFSRQQLLNVGWSINDGGLANDCNINYVSGTVLYDELNDGCDPNDFNLDNYLINVNNGTDDAAFDMDENGNYVIALDTGNYTLSILNLDSNFTSTPPTQSVNFTGQDEIIDDVDFCITANQQFEDLSIDIFPLEDTIPGFETDYQIIVSNNGTQTVPNVQITFGYDESLQTYVSSTVPTSGISTDLLNFQFANLEPFSQELFEITLINVVPPTLNSGDILSLTVSVTPDANDTTPDDNTTIFDQTVVNSFDPNDKMVVQGDEIADEDIDQYLDYRIRFQNLGTANALNVKITDTIDNNLDWTTFQPITSSHDYRVEIVDGEQINYYFDNINLPFETADPEGSNGYITYKIKPKSTVQIGDTFENTAYIYFDFNLPIITNTVVTTVVDNLSVDEFDLSQIKIYPNPVSDILHLDLPSDVNLNSIELFDIQGRLIKTFDAQTKLDFNGIQQGVYIMKLNTDSGDFNQKVVRE